MIRTLSLLFISLSVTMTSSFLTAENIPDATYKKICKACENCCSSYDNVEIAELPKSTLSKKKSKVLKKKKAKKKQGKRRTQKKKIAKKKQSKRSIQKKNKTTKRQSKQRVPKKTKAKKKQRKASSKSRAKSKQKKRSSLTKAKTMNKQVTNKKSLWKENTLYGSTISTASLIPITSEIQNGQFKVAIKSLFSFDCILKFNSKGQPSMLSNCQSKSSSWRVKDKNIALDCQDTDTRSTCTGNYTLAFSGSNDTNETHRVTLSLLNE